MQQSKRCARCNEVKPLSAFPSHPTCSQGVRPECRPCRNEMVKEWRKANDASARATMKAANAKWYAANRDAKRASNQRWRRENPETYQHYNARNAVQRALTRGDLIKEPCLFCDDPDAHAHHHDYDAPLDVTWLCRKHHGLVHRQVD